jgi:Mg-chelatase subunit ChlD
MVRHITTTLPNAFPNFHQSITFVQPVTAAPAPVASKPFKAKKAGTNGFHYFLLLDESGSMSDLTKDTIGGVNTLIKSQAKDNDGTKITVIKFEGGNILTPIDGVQATSLGEFRDYSPRGGTNLLDAVGYTIEKANALLATKSRKRDRPSIFIQIITDGQENQSRKFNRERIKEMLQSCEKADWIVSYVGANVDSFSEAHSIGINTAAVSNYSTSKTASTYQSMSSSLSRMKSLRSSGITGQAIYESNAVYTDAEKTEMGE